MSWNPNDPFADITFDAPTEPGPDELLRILGGRGGAGKESFTPMANPPIDANAKKLAEEARQRVNDNSKGTGVKAYTDEKGQTVLTNTGSASMAVPDAPPNKFGGAANIATPIFDTLSKLRVEKDAPAAQALYDSLQQTIVSERTRLEQEAIRFAESKVGTTSLQNTLLAAEMADKTDPAYYPGIGDSPITAGIRTQLGQSRILAERESKSFLGANLTYNSLAKVEKEAAFEYTRVQTARDNRDSRQADRKDLIDYNKQATADAKAAQLEETASGLSPEQVKRVQQLSEDTGDFTGNLSEDKTTAFKMIARNKDKGYQAAINAADSSLPTMALQGNNFAARIVIKEEAYRTGRSEESVAKDMAMLKKSMLDPAFAESVFAATIKDPKELAAHKKAFRELKQSKPDEFSAKNAALAMENMKIRKDV